MSAIKPNKNFYNETMTHTPYKEPDGSRMMSLYDQFMKPKNGSPNSKVNKKQPDSSIETVGFDTWFKNI